MKSNIHKYLILLSFLSPPPTLAADTLGRLFFTPEQREQLETARARRDRRQPAPELDGKPAPAVAAPQPKGPDVVTFSGIVRRSDGKSTIWVNGKPVTERNRLQNDGELAITGVRNDGTVSVAVPQASRRAALKVGQSLDVESGVIEESYARRVTGARAEAALPSAQQKQSEHSSTSEAVSRPRPRARTEDSMADQALSVLQRLRPEALKSADDSNQPATALDAKSAAKR